MPFDYSVPRTISSPNDYPTRGSNNPYTPGIYLDSISDHQQPASNNRLSPGPGPDQISRTNETDEGYYTNSQLDAQTVHSMNIWNMNQERQNKQHGQMLGPLAYPQPAPENPGSRQLDSDVQHNQTNADHAVQLQNSPSSLACGHGSCTHVSRTQADFKYVFLEPLDIEQH
jgi:hypothetical protein